MKIRYTIGWICSLLGLGLLLFLVWSFGSLAVTGLGRVWMEIPSIVRDQMIEGLTPICQGAAVFVAAMVLLAVANVLIAKPDDADDSDAASKEDK